MKAVYFIEANVRMGALCYLPLSSGLLRANAETSDIVRAHYAFKPFIYAIDPLATILARFDEPPAVLALSLSMWNEQISLAVAGAVKETWPDCLIVMGGPQVPHHPEAYMERHQFIDICVRGEGEEAFREILERFTESRSFDGIMGATWRALDGGVVYTPGERPFERALDIYPSPYLEGVFDDLAVGDEPPFQAIIETNRGCPFHCTFCLAAGTIISTMGGDKPIEAVLPGDVVLGWDETKGILTCNTIERVVHMGAKPTVRITAGGKSVEATADHKFFTRTGWRTAGELRIGDSVLSDVRFLDRRLAQDTAILASGRCEERGGNRGLQRTRLANLDYLGHGQIESGDGREDQGVCWAIVEAIDLAGFQNVYDLINAAPHPNFFANGLLAHNCYWGKGGLSRKYRYHDLERVYAELDWCAAHRIRYVFNADSNFGMNKRDGEIADYLVALKQRTGYPDKFRTCFGKNTDDKIFQIGSLFHKHNLEKGITLARQSNDLDVLINIKRGNIKMETYRALQARFNDQNIPIYSELILGLPGETVETWRRGIDELLSAGLRNQLFIYFCQVYPNTDLADPDYQASFGIETRRVELNEIHGSVRDAALIPEYEDIITTTAAMPLKDWRRMAILSWVTMLMHSLKLGFFVMAWLFDRHGVRHVDFLDYLAAGKFAGADMIRCELAAFEAKLDDILAGHGRGCIVEGCGVTYWDIEEAAFIRCMEAAPRFYDELRGVVAQFLGDFDATELDEVITYQKARIPTRFLSGASEIAFEHNWPDYFEARFTNSPVELKKEPQRMTVHPIDYNGDMNRFARESILWGRKSGTLLVRVEPENIEPAQRVVAR